MPMAPPPSTISDDGTSSAAIASRLVQYGTSARPSIGGMAGSVPVATTIPRVAVSSWSPACTRPGATIRPLARTKRPPLPSNRSTATVSSQLSVACSRMRRATGAQSGWTSAVPATPSIRRASCSRCAARIIILDGTQPQ